MAGKFGADTETGLWASIDELEEMEAEDDSESLIELDSLGKWAIAFEPNGHEGARKAVMESVSIGGCAFSVFWNVELDSSIMYAVDGHVLTSFTLLDLERRSGSAPEALDQMMAELGIGHGLSIPALKARLLALGEAISGQPITPEFLRSPKFAFQINNPIQDPLISREYLDPRAPFLDEPEFARILANPSPTIAPTITNMIVAIVVSATLSENPLVEDVLRLLNHGEQHKGEREMLQAKLFEQSSEGERKAGSLRSDSTPNAQEEAVQAQRKSRSLSVLARALNPHQVNAAYGAALEAASIPLLSIDDSMRLNVLWKVAKHIESSGH
ncbi:DUF6461 domain-containing protein [Streptosporangium sp. NPDC006930]|uniref:DUF6461 domain-containing protein n=1 Tax=unclassified Streptosporangium TaxID=2632669 RepID=UPI003438F08D